VGLVTVVGVRFGSVLTIVCFLLSLLNCLQRTVHGEGFYVCVRSCDKYALRILRTFFPGRHVCWFKMVYGLLFPNVHYVGLMMCCDVHVYRFNDVLWCARMSV
jgi:hypothetical protein